MRQQIKAHISIDLEADATLSGVALIAHVVQAVKAHMATPDPMFTVERIQEEAELYETD